jgi:hypothetical protein
MSLIGDIGDPKKDVAALAPLADDLEAKAEASLKELIVDTVIPALKAAAIAIGDGLTVTITIAVSRRPATP